MMKKGILLALAGLALGAFAVPDAHAWWWGHHKQPDIHLHAWGANLISSDEGGIPTPVNTVPVTAFQSGKVNVTPGIRPRVGPD